MDRQTTAIYTDTIKRARRIAAREQRTIIAVLDRAVQLYDQEHRRAQAALRKETT